MYVDRLQVQNFYGLNSTKALTKYERPKMKRDARQKCNLFLSKRLNFWRAFFSFSAVSFSIGL